MPCMGFKEAHGKVDCYDGLALTLSWPITPMDYIKKDNLEELYADSVPDLQFERKERERDGRP